MRRADRLQRGAGRRVERLLRIAGRDGRAGIEDIGERTLGDDQMRRAVVRHGKYDRQAPSLEVVGDLVDLRHPRGGEVGHLAGGDQGGVERVLDPRLQRGVEEGEPRDLGRGSARGIERGVQRDPALRQGAGLVGAQHVDRAEILDRFQPAHDDAAPAHRPRAGGKRHGDDRRQQFRRQPDRQRDREEQRIDRRPFEQQIGGQHEEHDHRHHPHQHGAEIADAAHEGGLGLGGGEARRDRAVLGAPSREHGQHARGAAAHRGAEEDAVAAPCERCVRGDGARSLLDRERLAGHRGFADQEILRRQHDAIGGDQIAGRQQHDVAGHDMLGRHQRLGTVAQHPRAQRQPPFQRRDGVRRAMLLHEADQRAAEDDGEDDRGVDEFPQRQRHRGRDDQDEDQRALELPQQQAQAASPRALADAVPAEPRQPRGRDLRGEAASAGAEPGEKRRRIAAPIGVVWLHPADQPSPGPAPRRRTRCAAS
jgi:hypothetical protein